MIGQEEVIGEAEEVEETNQKKGFGLFDNFKKLQTRVFDMFDETTDSTM